MLIFQIKKVFQLKNGLTTSLLLLFCFFENAKNLGQSDDAKRRRKRGWPNVLCNIKPVCKSFTSIVLD